LVGHRQSGPGVSFQVKKPLGPGLRGENLKLGQADWGNRGARVKDFCGKTTEIWKRSGIP